MNEQLVVKNFGPIKEATVDFKRVTVFIGPTGGGKSTLAKLAATFKQPQLYTSGSRGIEATLSGYGIDFTHKTSTINWRYGLMGVESSGGKWTLVPQGEIKNQLVDLAEKVAELHRRTAALVDFQKSDEHISVLAFQEKANIENEFQSVSNFFSHNIALSRPYYIPAERVLLSVLDETWPVLIKDKIGLPPALLFFAQGYLAARSAATNLAISFFDSVYEHFNGKDFIVLPSIGRVPLNKAASGIQSVTPMLVLLEYLSRNTQQAQSFIIEEPELNLFPTAQFELVKILVDKCARLNGKNDLILTTHSPYVLTALNLMCYAFRIAQQDEATAKQVAKLIPRHCWIDPEQFAAYYVDLPSTKRKQQVRSIINKKTGLIEENELDTASDELGDIFDKLVRLRKPVKTTARVK